jgi:hypothetical protein
LQGGGLIRSSEGDKAVLLGQKKEDREKSDQRILGSGGFVGAVLHESERLLEKKYKPKRPIEKLIEVVAGRLGLKPKLICSGSRQQKYSEARSLVACLAGCRRDKAFSRGGRKISGNQSHGCSESSYKGKGIRKARSVP